MSAASILIIDDDPDSVKATRAILEDRKYKVRAACNAVEGLARLEEEGADAIILDVMMRECAEGFVLARRIKKENRFSNIPILMLTGMQDATGTWPLLIRKNEDSSLCLECHKKEKSVIGSPHDLRYSSPETVNAGGKKPSESGPCGSCPPLRLPLWG